MAIQDSNHDGLWGALLGGVFLIGLAAIKSVSWFIGWLFTLRHDVDTVMRDREAEKETMARIEERQSEILMEIRKK